MIVIGLLAITCSKPTCIIGIELCYCKYKEREKAFSSIQIMLEIVRCEIKQGSCSQ